MKCINGYLFFGVLFVLSPLWSVEAEIMIPSPLLAESIAKFKKEVGYEELQNTISDSEIVLLDWPSVLKKFSMGSDEWISESPPKGSAYGDNNAEIFTSLMHAEKVVNITVNVLSNSNLDALSLPFEAMTRYSASYILMRRIVDGPGDLYLTVPPNMKQNSGKMVFKNIYIDITTKSDLDVRDFADYLYKIMSTAVIQRSAYQIPEFNANVSSSAIKMGDEFTVTVNAVTNEPDEWRIDIGQWPMDKLETTGSGPHEYTFKALMPGPMEINFDIFHTKTLMSYMKKVHINILE